MKQRALCARLGFPATDPMVRVFRSLRPRWVARWTVQALHKVASQLESLDSLSDPPKRDGAPLHPDNFVCDLELFGGLLHPPTSAGCWRSPYSEVPKPDGALVRNVRELLHVLGRDSCAPRVRDRRALEELRMELARAVEAARDSNAAELIDSVMRPVKWSGGFLPPVPGTAHIRPLRAVAEIHAEDCVMDHCVGNYVNHRL